MFVKNSKTLPPKFKPFVIYRPDLVTLGRVAKSKLWPDQVINKIVELYKEIGLPDPLTQKVVNPYLEFFGGRFDKEKQRYTLDDVNWDEVIDYFLLEVLKLIDYNKYESEASKYEKKYNRKPSTFCVYFWKSQQEENNG